jgi:hypothetical protein
MVLVSGFDFYLQLEGDGIRWSNMYNCLSGFYFKREDA